MNEENDVKNENVIHPGFNVNVALSEVDSRTVRNSHSALSRRQTKTNFPEIPKNGASKTSSHAERWKRNEWKAWNVANAENKRTVKYLWADGFRAIQIAKRADKSQKNWKTGNTCGKNSIRVQWGSILLSNPRSLENVSAFCNPHSSKWFYKCNYRLFIKGSVLTWTWDVSCYFQFEKSMVLLLFDFGKSEDWT